MRLHLRCCWFAIFVFSESILKALSRAGRKEGTTDCRFCALRRKERERRGERGEEEEEEEEAHFAFKLST